MISVAIELDDHAPGGYDHVAVQWSALWRVDDRVLNLDGHPGRSEFVAQPDLLGAGAPQDAFRAASRLVRLLIMACHS